MAGGGAKAICYLGFIRVLEEEGIQIDYQAVQSGAAIIMCYVASGMSDQEIIKKFSKFRFFHHFSWDLFNIGGITSPYKLVKFHEKIANNSDISDLPYPTYITYSDLTDWDNPHKVTVGKGSLGKYATISSLVVPLMGLYKKDGRVLGDAGYTSVYNVDFLRKKGADVIIGLHPDAMKDTNLPEIYMSTTIVIKTLMKQIENHERSVSDVDFEVRDFGVNVGLQEFAKAEEMYEGGRQTAKKHLAEIKELINFSS